MKVAWDNEMVSVLHLTAIPRANLMGPRSDISHLDFSWSQNQAFSPGGLDIKKMSLIWTANITVPEGEL